MQNTKLPPRPSLEYLRKTAKERLEAMRREKPRAQLAEALLAIAQEHGFSSWRALKAEVDRRQVTSAERFFAACKQGDITALRALLADDASLIHVQDTAHAATGLHFAARNGQLDAVRALLAAGADPQRDDDVTGLGVIGWACQLPERDIDRDVVSVLVEHGARHHLFSAIAVGDADLVRTLVEQSPESLDRRMSRGDHGQSPLHFAITRGRSDLVALLIELGADIEATDANGQTPLGLAMLRGDRAAVTCLLAAGATAPHAREEENTAARRNTIGASVQGVTPILLVRDIAATLRWYVALGFAEAGRYPTDGTTVYWGMVSLGGASIMFEPGTADGASATLLFVTDSIHDQYDAFKDRQLQAVESELAGRAGELAQVEFVETLHEPIFGGLRFSVRDCNGYTLQFLQGK